MHTPFEEYFPEILSVMDSFLFKNGKMLEARREPILNLAAQTTFIIFPPNMPALPEIDAMDFMLRMKDIIQEERKNDLDDPFLSNEPKVLDFVIEKLQDITPPGELMAPAAIFFMTLIDELHDAMMDLIGQFLDDHPDLFD